MEKRITELLEPLVNAGITEIQTSLDKITQNKDWSLCVGSFLQHHLIIEMYLEKILFKVAPILNKINHKNGKPSWRFIQKLYFLKELDLISPDTANAIEAINQIRNSLAHNMSVPEIKHDWNDRIGIFLKKWDKDNELESKLSGQDNFFKKVELISYFILIEIMMKSSLEQVSAMVKIDFEIKQAELLRSLLIQT